jgi:cupin superfamily acireductone dioxygenase involved in methionine salvage
MITCPKCKTKDCLIDVYLDRGCGLTTAHQVCKKCGISVKGFEARRLKQEASKDEQIKKLKTQVKSLKREISYLWQAMHGDIQEGEYPDLDKKYNQI